MKPFTFAAVLLTVASVLAVPFPRFHGDLAQAAGHPLSPIQQAIRDAYTREFHEIVPQPAIFDDVHGTCRGLRHLITTAYLKASATTSTLLTMTTSLDGTEVLSKSRRIVLTPAGTFRLLIVLVRYPNTFNDDSLELWQAAQVAVNQDFVGFAKTHGLEQPIVSFANTNVVIDRSLLRKPKDPVSTLPDLTRLGYVPSNFDVVVVIDGDPLSLSGGRSYLDEHFISVGNYTVRRALDARHWRGMAATVYHHEMAHQWGWEHDWAPTCGGYKPDYEPFIAPPVLFGWEDVDGDGVPEILDHTPYGRDAVRNGARHEARYLLGWTLALNR